MSGLLKMNDWEREEHEATGARNFAELLNSQSTGDGGLRNYNSENEAGSDESADKS